MGPGHMVVLGTRSETAQLAAPLEPKHLFLVYFSLIVVCIYDNFLINQVSIIQSVL